MGSHGIIWICTVTSVCFGFGFADTGTEYTNQNSQSMQYYSFSEPGIPSQACNSFTCPRRYVCVLENNKPKCVRKQKDLCTVMGDSHYRTFDGKHYDFMGTCTYTLVSICGDVVPAGSRFSVLVKHDNRGKALVSKIVQVTFKTAGYVIDIRKSEIGLVRVNYKRSQLPVSLLNGVLSIIQSGNSAFLEFGNDAHISYDWNNVIRVELTRWYIGSVCGMCGNYDHNAADDFQTPHGSYVPDATAFGKSWKVEDNPVCWDDCNGPCMTCPATKAQKYLTVDYCGLISKTDGPFSACHSIMDPKVYMQNCVFDVCLKDGNKRFSCEALKAYADACQREGVNISQWRETAGCPLNCPINSVYKLCGRACPPTCQDPEGTSICAEACLETCECDPGLVLIKGQCLPRESCGCFYDGLSFGSDETFWVDKKCHYKCFCYGQSQGMGCYASACRAGEECIVKGGIRDCYPNKYSTSTVSGGHYITFDGVRYNFQGACQYQLSSLCEQNSGITPFQVNIWNENQSGTKVSYTTTVKVYGTEIKITHQKPGMVMVDGLLLNLPYSTADGRLFLYRNPNAAVITTDFGLTVTFDWSRIVKVTIPSTYKGKVCGLGGNYNDNRSDDLIPRGKTTPASVDTFAQSWNITECKEIVINRVCEELEEQEQKQRKEYTGCGIVLDPLGPFHDCHKFVDPEDYFINCLYDFCLLEQRQTFFCTELASYVQACQTAGGNVLPWRTPQFCSYSCPSLSHYELCANGCPVTCKGFTSPAGCDSSCREGCVCDDGLILSGGTCVSLSHCGCVDDNGIYHTIGESYYVGKKCAEKCTCNKSGRQVCTVSSCSTNEECRIERGVRGCFSVGSALCTVSGYSHYKTFDKQVYGYQGLCSYVLAQSCEGANLEEPKNLTQFKVTIKNEQLPSSAAVVKSVTVEIYGQKLTLKQKRKGIVMVNGIDFRLPVTLLSGKLRAECYGLGIIIMSDFGLKVNYDLSYHVTVTVPSSYNNRTCGMCGDYNGNPDDDVSLVTSDIVALAEKWKILDDEPCNATNNPCPTFDEVKREAFAQDDYCGILKATSGPFAKCHSFVNPEPYINNCVADLCQSSGDSTTLCTSAQAYATACKEAGVTDIEWRTDYFCDIRCPPHSHYTRCAELCFSSCAVTDPYGCGTDCAEGCQCDVGYLFDGAECVPIQECGCFGNGRYYKLNESLLNDNCSQMCTCDSQSRLSCQKHSCTENEECQIQDAVRSCIKYDHCKHTKCREKENCQLKNGKPVCVPDFNSTCWAWGDPHFQTFDARNYDFNGTCSYVLTMYTGKDKDLETFHILIKNDNRGSQASSFVKLVNIVVYGTKITIQAGEYGKIRVNGFLKNLPLVLAEGAINVTKSGFIALVETKFGMTVSYDWNWHVIVNIPSSYYNKVSGLCGNFNENPDDDQRAPDNTEMTSIVEWARSWKIYDRDPFCFDHCTGNCPTCEESKKRHYSGDDQCGLIFKEDGPFRECQSIVSPNKFFDNCLYEVCMNESSKSIHCQAIEVYATTCVNQGAKIYDWRTPSNCQKKCFENSHYEACGSACPATCNDRNAPIQCIKPCVETCECDEGFILNVDKCVPITSCGCQYNEQFYQPNQEFWANDKCTILCKCNPILGMVVCEQSACKSSETCSVANGILGCYPGKYTICSAFGTLHYTTFDGKRFDFLGTCIYQLAKVASSDSNLTPFTVSVQNDNRNGKTMSYTREVTVQVYNLIITMSKDYPQKIKVNGLFTELPYFYRASQISAYISGYHVFIKTDFDLTVTYDGFSYARVILPTTYKNSVTGLCGNNNEDPSDDFAIGNGQIAETAEEFGNNWKVHDVPGCTGAPSCIDCPTCSNEEKEEYKGNNFCGLLTKPQGPFSLCYSVVDPRPYFEDCVFDICRFIGHQFIVSSSISPYVSECQRQGIKIKEWRTASFYPLNCPPNSHYELCGKGCPTTCYNLSAPVSCVESCVEGCYCDEGFVLSGKKCVPITQCGCVYKDKYYKLGEEFYIDYQCRRKCKCGNNSLVTCQRNTCGNGTECKVVGGVQGCHAIGFGNCVACGDSLYLTFDGALYDVRGNCKYILIRSVSDSNSFYVEADRELHGDGKVTVTKMLTVYINGNFFHLDRHSSWTILVNNEKYNLPYLSSDGQFWANQEGNNVVLQSSIGIKVLFDRSYYISFWLPSTFSGFPQGLCGNFNKDKSDDFRLPNGTVVADTAKFSNSWSVSESGSECEGCPEGRCPTCKPSDEAKARSINNCGLLEDPHGPFKDCHALVNPKKLIEHCVYDVCNQRGGKEALCMNFQAYTLKCQEAGVNIGPWRGLSGCPLDCPLNSHYELCTETCHITCAAMFVHPTCSGKCYEGCECDPGYLFDGDQCVSVGQCGSVYHGRYIKANESVVSNDCSEECTSRFGSVHCKKMSCMPNEICRLRYGQRGCFSNEAECLIRANHQLTTFDGISGAFPSDGTFVLASSCNASSEGHFLIAVDDHKCTTESRRRSLHVFTPQGAINVNSGLKIWFNGRPVEVAGALGDGSVRVAATQYDATVEIVNQITVFIGIEGDVKLNAKPSLAGNTCGACGNFNGEKKDDLRLKNGELVNDISDAIHSWTTQFFSTCMD
ncbi:LOW QUALITY PROTEIN: IgGFc-binding protein-like [Discoglossus pictus]